MTDHDLTKRPTYDITDLRAPKEAPSPDWALDSSRMVLPSNVPLSTLRPLSGVQETWKSIRTAHLTTLRRLVEKAAVGDDDKLTLLTEIENMPGDPGQPDDRYSGVGLSGASTASQDEAEQEEKDLDERLERIEARLPHEGRLAPVPSVHQLRQFVRGFRRFVAQNGWKPDAQTSRQLEQTHSSLIRGPGRRIARSAQGSASMSEAFPDPTADPAFVRPPGRAHEDDRDVRLGGTEREVASSLAQLTEQVRQEPLQTVVQYLSAVVVPNVARLEQTGELAPSSGIQLLGAAVLKPLQRHVVPVILELTADMRGAIGTDVEPTPTTATGIGALGEMLSWDPGHDTWPRQVAYYYEAAQLTAQQPPSQEQQESLHRHTHNLLVVAERHSIDVGEEVQQQLLDLSFASSWASSGLPPLDSRAFDRPWTEYVADDSTSRLIRMGLSMAISKNGDSTTGSPPSKVTTRVTLGMAHVVTGFESSERVAAEFFNAGIDLLRTDGSKRALARTLLNGFGLLAACHFNPFGLEPALVAGDGFDCAVNLFGAVQESGAVYKPAQKELHDLAMVLAAASADPSLAEGISHMDRAMIGRSWRKIGFVEPEHHDTVDVSSIEGAALSALNAVARANDLPELALPLSPEHVAKWLDELMSKHVFSHAAAWTRDAVKLADTLKTMCALTESGDRLPQLQRKLLIDSPPMPSRFQAFSEEEWNTIWAARMRPCPDLSTALQRAVAAIAQHAR